MTLSQTRKINTGIFINNSRLLKDQSLQDGLIGYSYSISKVTGLEVNVNIYEGIGLNNKKSIYCDYEGKYIPFRLYLEITTDIEGMDMFIVDFNLPAEMRGRGHGSRLICELLGIVSHYSIGKITLNPVNRRAEKFWTGFGFQNMISQKLMLLDLKQSGHVAKCTSLLYRNLKKLIA